MHTSHNTDAHAHADADISRDFPSHSSHKNGIATNFSNSRSQSRTSESDNCERKSRRTTCIMPLVLHLHQQPLQLGTSKGSYLHSKEPYVHPAAASRKHTSNTARHSERHTDAHVGQERDTYEREREGDERGRRGVKSPSISPIVPLDTHRHTHAHTPSHSVSPTSLSPSPIDFTVIDGGGGAGLEKRSIYSCDHAEEWIVGDTEGEKGECEINAPLKGRRGQKMTQTSTSRTLQNMATHGNTLHHTAAHCNTLQHDECDVESATDAHVTMLDNVSPNAQHGTEVALLKSQLDTEY